MAEPLKNQFGPGIPRRIAAQIEAVHPAFDSAAFLRDALDGYETLELMDRGRRIADALRRHLPDDYEAALRIVLDSVDRAPAPAGGGSLAAFFYLPHTCFVASHGLDHFEASMQAQYRLTQRFTAEFSIRPFLERHPQATLDRLAAWAQDANEHVRRLVSEGTRPRLPWAPRLRAFQRDPGPVLALLERLRDDPSPTVRRSVANNLNDIGKDHPDRLLETARRWWVDGGQERRELIRHALRTAVKRADPQALSLLGVGEPAQVRLDAVRITPARPRLGESVRIAFRLSASGAQPQRLQVDLRVHFVKASGKARPRVFRLRTLELASGASVDLARTVSLADLTTRRHHPGWHAVEAQINGRVHPLGGFELVPG